MAWQGWSRRYRYELWWCCNLYSFHCSMEKKWKIWDCDCLWLCFYILILASRWEDEPNCQNKSKFGALEVPIRPCTRLSLSHNSTVRLFPRVESYPLELNTHIWSLWDFIPYETVWGMFDNYSLVNIQKAIEHGHRNSGFTHWKWWFP